MILALQTAGPVTHLALYKELEATTPVAEETWESGRELATELLGRLGQFLESQDAAFTDVTGIVIFSGPGSFTSLRIGHSVANALADSLGVPIASAQGDQWIAEAKQVLASTPPGRPALPFYGAEAHITAPTRKPGPTKT